MRFLSIFPILFFLGACGNNLSPERARDATPIASSAPVVSGDASKRALRAARDEIASYKKQKGALASCLQQAEGVPAMNECRNKFTKYIRRNFSEGPSIVDSYSGLSSDLIDAVVSSQGDEYIGDSSINEINYRLFDFFLGVIDFRVMGNLRNFTAKKETSPDFSWISAKDKRREVQNSWGHLSRFVCKSSNYTECQKILVEIFNKNFGDYTDHYLNVYSGLNSGGN